ncbi:acetyl-coenzyme A synthetase [Kwoniella pini CBS 10737]|uniref:Acetyl-coenzyme A synthetase n=1 Tax=Kwoniella pini CBS 10737 TaxID=1296096 RepID=A0A1B9HU18_9TREE|nr:acetyl-coenzyme A synthetase [Kwoniella pini CBS 10737]OCF46765.1 acetyl-coenzyme A synthetase [Kwoniella pini CBS 10737]
METAQTVVHNVHPLPDSVPESEDLFPPPPRLRGQEGRPKPHIGPNYQSYLNEWKKTVGPNSDKWWFEKANECLDWYTPFKTVRAGGFENGDVQWFPEGTLNASYNCLDRHFYKNPNKTAIIYEADEPSESREISYAELMRETCRVANVLKSWGVKKGDAVSVYLPMTWQAAAAFLACARVGAVHSAVFAGFSAESLRDRVNDCECKVLITTDEGRRGGKSIATKAIVDAALQQCPLVEHVLVLRRTGNKVPFTEGRDKWWDEECAKVPTYCPCEPMASEDPLFILYTSGSTGKPKGVVHCTAGYLLGAYLTVKYVFDVHADDKFACMADVGWITGHTYIVYGPLANGVTTTVFESTPVYPTASRYWDFVDKWKATHLYTAPTAIRLLRRMGEEHVKNHDLSSLRVLGSVGEPINPEAWHWYNDYAGKKNCAIVDTYWMTETGSIVVTPLPGAISTKPGSATFPFFGMDVDIIDPQSGQVLQGNDVEGVLVAKAPWPSLARTVFKDHKRYLETYMKPYPGYFFFGDGAARDYDGYIWIKGRVDDVINVSGHRLSTAEVESALILHKGVAETAVVGSHDDITGQAVYAFVTMKPEFDLKSTKEADLNKELAIQVRKVIGPFAAPKKIYLVTDLPKTRSGKIMRRILRKIVAGEGDQLGDLSSIADPSIVDEIKEKVGAAVSK